MKKTLAAVAVLGAFAGSALAADVTLYGKVDLGLQYTNMQNEAGVDGADRDSYSMDSGNGSASRWGLKGSEQISENLTVGFNLEDGIKADTGETGDMFDRVAMLYVDTNYGKLSMGRFGALDSGTGPIDMGAGLSASGTGYGTDILDQGEVLYTYSRVDNAIAYSTPEFAGMKLTVMTSLQTDGSTSGEKGEGTHYVDRYHGIGLTGQWGALGAGIVVSMADPANKAGADKQDDDAYNVTAGVNYDFGVAKAFLAANYFDGGYSSGWTAMGNVKFQEEKLVGDKETMVDVAGDYSQWGTVASVAVPLSAGKLQAMIGYAEGTFEPVAGADIDVTRYTVGAYYEYPLSKRTYLYTAAGYTQTESDNWDADQKYTQVIGGLVHNF